MRERRGYVTSWSDSRLAAVIVIVNRRVTWKLSVSSHSQLTVQAEGSGINCSFPERSRRR